MQVLYSVRVSIAFETGLLSHLKDLCNVVKSEAIQTVRKFPKMLQRDPHREGSSADMGTLTYSGGFSSFKPFPAYRRLQDGDSTLIHSSHKDNVQVRGPGFEAVRK